MKMSSVAGAAALLAAALPLAQTASAQNLSEHCGFNDRTEETGFIREGGIANPIPVAYDAIFTKEDFAGWGFTSARPNERRIDGVSVVLADADGSTAENVVITVFNEDLAAPGNPDFSSPVGSFAFALFGMGAGGAAEAFTFELTFPTPLFASTAGDTFIEVDLSQGANQVFVAALWGDDPQQANPVSFDISNARTSETGHGLGTGGYTYFYDLSSSAAIALPAQILVSPLVMDQAGLALGVQTSQASLPGSNAPNFSASFFSALHPCDTQDRTGAPRTDDIAWMWNDDRFTASESVVVLMAPNGFSSAPIDLSVFLPGSTGGICLDTALPFVTMGTATTDIDGFASLTLALDASVRGSLAGQSFSYQAVLLDVLGAAVHTTGCATQQW